MSYGQRLWRQVARALAKIPEIKTSFARVGTAEVATDPMPPSIADGYVMLKDPSDWPKPHRSKAQILDNITAALAEVPGNAYEVSQPIQLRFNELISGVRSDLGVKIYGDDLDQLLKAGNAVAGVLSKIPGADDVQVEQVEGLPVLSINPNRAALYRYGLNVADVQAVIAAATAGVEAGQIFEGDRRFAIVVRLPEHLRSDLLALERLPIPLPHAGSGPETGASSGYVPLAEVATLTLAPGPNQISREDGKRRIVV